MSEQQIIPAQARPHRQDARDLQSRLYREIGLGAVAYELFAPEKAERETEAPPRDRAIGAARRFGGKAA
jgi:hypothetical protein